MWCALMALVGKRGRPARHEDSAFDGINVLAAGPRAFFQDCSVHSAIQYADCDPLARGARITKETIRCQESKDLVKHIATGLWRAFIHELFPRFRKWNPALHKGRRSTACNGGWRLRHGGRL